MRTYLAPIYLLLQAPIPANGNEIQRPSLKFIKEAAQKYLDQNTVCAVPKVDGLYSRQGEWENGVSRPYLYRFDPFVRAGLLSDIGPASDHRRRYVVTKFGKSRLARCLLDANAYPEKVVDGFRIGRRVISRVEKTHSENSPTKVSCFWIDGAKVYYDIKIDENWFDPKKFDANIGAYGRDDRGQNFVLLPLYSFGEEWYLGDITNPHNQAIICPAGS